MLEKPTFDRFENDINPDRWLFLIYGSFLEKELVSRAVFWGQQSTLLRPATLDTYQGEIHILLFPLNL
jgi:hypothetical protein